ncbi:hypothetical protein DF214_17370 [Pectobacterium atrosepticum]|nr:hypothetical protein EV46_20790 [Pectobacterium atrosepticum]ATY92613.1 hypothetical protein CVS35_20785 [Pectobacterium atrosepticum]KFX12160.1 hypothetical protein JV34_18785 [Pectobacterium atrosepticum]KFX23015.1 hypothetical protein KP24_17225 [Pectobacterium atrosepticum]PWD55770.1 hypothetical protein DF214_17370 [Pectobacterium atrosepticum]
MSAIVVSRPNKRYALNVVKLILLSYVSVYFMRCFCFFPEKTKKRENDNSNVVELCRMAGLNGEILTTSWLNERRLKRTSYKKMAEKMNA